MIIELLYEETFGDVTIVPVECKVLERIDLTYGDGYVVCDGVKISGMFAVNYAGTNNEIRIADLPLKKD